MGNGERNLNKRTVKILCTCCIWWSLAKLKCCLVPTARSFVYARALVYLTAWPMMPIKPGFFHLFLNKYLMTSDSNLVMFFNDSSCLHGVPQSFLGISSIGAASLKCGRDSSDFYQIWCEGDFFLAEYDEKPVIGSGNRSTITNCTGLAFDANYHIFDDNNKSCVKIGSIGENSFYINQGCSGGKFVALATNNEQLTSPRLVVGAVMAFAVAYLL